MRQFFKFLLASCLGTAIALFLLIGFGFGLLSNIGEGMSNRASKKVLPNAVLHLELDDAIPELMDNVEKSSFTFNDNRILSIHDIIKVIKMAKTDDNIKGIFIEADNVMAGFSNLNELRDAIVDFKSTGKFVQAYSSVYSQGAYYLASAADEVNLAPLGIVDFRGFSAQVPFFKEMFDGIGFETEIFYAGKYKSATEPFRRNNMSPESKEQTSIYLDAMYTQMLNGISETRGVSVAQLREAANTYAGLSPETAIAGGLVDKIQYREAVMAEIRDALGLETDKKVNLTSLQTYHKSRVPAVINLGPEVAILIAEGSIVDGKGDIGQIGGTSYVKEIEALRKNDNVKAVVLRVNSGGGSAMASDHIWQAIEDLKATGKPVVVSMGDYAASGGYYIACAADSIFAQESTLTGSIGVFSVFPQVQKMLKDKIGISFDSVTTGPFATGLNPVFNLSPAEKQLLQAHTDQVYGVFLKRVSDGRNMSVAEVNEIAQGRVWVGTQGVENGLVDRIGNLQDAVESAATLADLGDYETAVYPTPKAQWQRLLEEITGEEDFVTNTAIRNQLGSLYPHYQYLNQVVDTKGVQMRVPFLIPFE